MRSGSAEAVLQRLQEEQQGGFDGGSPLLEWVLLPEAWIEDPTASIRQDWRLGCSQSKR